MRKGVVTVLGVIAIGLTVGIILLPSTSKCKCRPRSDCVNNLRQIGTYVTMYQSRYNAYPSSGAQFWNDLRSTVAKGSDGVFRCRVFGHGNQGPVVVDYRGPAPGAVLGPTTPPLTPIAADCTNNHWNEMIVLYFNGTVATVTPGTPAWAATIAATVVPPGRSEMPPHPAEAEILGIHLTGWASIYSFQVGLFLVVFGCVFWVAIRVAGTRIWT